MDWQTEFNNLIKEGLKDDYDNICLISREKLDKDLTVELPFCKHKFNYIPFYKELINQKIKYSNRYKLKSNEIMCPYCRHKYNGLLPYVPLKNVEIKYGINHPRKSVLNFNECIYINTKGNKCNNSCIGNYCSLHYNKCVKEEIIKDNKTYKCSYVFKRGNKKGECWQKKCFGDICM